MHKKQQHILDVYGKPITTLDELAESCIAVINEITPVVGFAWDIRYNPKVSCLHNAPIGQQTNWCRDDNRPINFPGLDGRFWIRYAGDSFDWIRNMNHTLTWTGTGGGGSYNGLWQPICSASHRTRRKVEDSRRVHGYRYEYEYPTPNCFSTDYKIFLSDWPDLELDFIAAEAAHELEENKKDVWAKVSKKWRNRQKFIFRHKFTWEDPATKAADNKFLTEYFDSHKYITCDINRK